MGIFLLKTLKATTTTKGDNGLRQASKRINWRTPSCVSAVTRVFQGFLWYGLAFVVVMINHVYIILGISEVVDYFLFKQKLEE